MTVPRFNLWCVTPQRAHVIAYDDDRASLEHHLPRATPDDDIRFVVLPDLEEPAPYPLLCQ